MADSRLNDFVSRGTNAERLAFTPTPPTPAGGNDPGYFFYETDTGNTYAWDGAAWDQVNSAAAALALDDLTDVATAGEASGDVLTYNGSGWVPQAPSGGSVTAWKDVVRVATTAAGTLASSFENGDTVDGVVLATGDRILIKNQATAADNGIYVVAASGAPSRATDADTGTEMVGAIIPVSDGTVNADRVFQCTTNATITIGSTSLSFSELGGRWRLAGGAYTSPGIWDQAVDGSVAQVDFTNLASFNEVMIINRLVTKSVSGDFNVRASTDNGSTFYSASGDYVFLSGNGVESNSTEFGQTNSTASSAARSGVFHVKNLGGDGCPPVGFNMTANANHRYFVASTSKINAIRIYPSAGGNFTGGKSYCLCR